MKVVEFVSVIISDRQFKPAETGLWGPEPDVDVRLSGETARHLALRWVVRLRYGLIVGEIGLIAALTFGLGISVPFAAIAAAIGIQGLSNGLLGLKINGLGRYAEHIVGALFTLDTLCLTLIIGTGLSARSKPCAT